jgi:hypothetical protein
MVYVPCALVLFEMSFKNSNNSCIDLLLHKS